MLVTRIVTTFATSFAIAACSSTTATTAKDDRQPATASDGTSVDSPTTSGDPAHCTSATATTQLQPVYLLFVVDGSANMGSGDKWTAMAPSLSTIIDGVAAAKDPSVGLGLIVYADSTDAPDASGLFGPYPRSSDVPIAYVDDAQVAALKHRLDTTPSSNVTPTQVALEGGYASLHQFNPSAPLLQTGGRKVLVLISGGVPYSLLKGVTCPDSDPVCSDMQIANSIALAQAAAHDADPILTFVVGVGPFPGGDSSYDPTFFGRLAVAGGTARSSTCNPNELVNEANVCDFQVTPGMKTPEELQKESFAAINAIREKLVSCQFTIVPPPSGFDLDTYTATVRLTTGGSTTTILPSATDGWSFDDPTTPKLITLNGKACSDYRASGGSIAISLACK